MLLGRCMDNRLTYTDVNKYFHWLVTEWDFVSRTQKEGKILEETVDRFSCRKIKPWQGRVLSLHHKWKERARYCWQKKIQTEEIWMANNTLKRSMVRWLASKKYKSYQNNYSCLRLLVSNNEPDRYRTYPKAIIKSVYKNLAIKIIKCSLIKTAKIYMCNTRGLFNKVWYIYSMVCFVATKHCKR